MCTCAEGRGKPGYFAPWQPGSLQVLGPESDPSLSKTIVVNPATQSTVHPAIDFTVKTPNVRMRVKVSLTLEPAAASSVNVDTDANTTVIAAAGTLWASLKGRTLNSNRRQSPAANVVGTGAAPLSVPTDTRLWGYTFEAETNGEEIFCHFTPPNTAAAPAAASVWVASVRYEAVGARLSKEEWESFRSQYGIHVGQPSVLT